MDRIGDIYEALKAKFLKHERLWPLGNEDYENLTFQFLYQDRRGQCIGKMEVRKDGFNGGFFVISLNCPIFFTPNYREEILEWINRKNYSSGTVTFSFIESKDGTLIFKCRTAVEIPKNAEVGSSYVEYYGDLALETCLKAMHDYLDKNFNWNDMEEKIPQSNNFLNKLPEQEQNGSDESSRNDSTEEVTA